jgi:hypothetical protein
MKKTTLIFFATLLLIGYSCKNDKTSATEIPTNNLGIEIVRFDQMLQNLDTNNIEKSYEEMEKKEPLFTDFYFKYLVELNNPKSKEFYTNLKGFLNYKSIKDIKIELNSQYKDISVMKNEFDNAFNFYKTYFPNDTVPKIYTFFSEYNYGVIIPPFNNAIGVGLDLFLGENHHEYSNPALNFPKFLVKTFDQKYIPTKVMYLFVEDKIGLVKGNKLLDQMIANGKKMYVVKKCFPNTPDSIIHEYSTKQMEWVAKNEAGIWTFLQKENLLFSTKMDDFQKLLNPSPNSSGMPAEAPGRTANYIGMKIIEQFVERNPNISLPELIKMSNAQKILELSKYKPDR